MNEFIRKLDGLGRIVIPKEYRKKLKIGNDSKLRIALDDGYIRIEKFSDIEDDINNKKELPEKIISKIKYGKIVVLNDEKDILLNNEYNINMIIIPIILYGEVIGSLIGYSYEREITDTDQKVLELIQSILIKNIEE